MTTTSTTNSRRTLYGNTRRRVTAAQVAKARQPRTRISWRGFSGKRLFCGELTPAGELYAGTSELLVS